MQTRFRLLGVFPLACPGTQPCTPRAPAKAGSSRSRQAALAADRTRTRPAAPPGRSKHEVGLAYDVRANGLTPAQIQRIGELGESIGLRWGGRFTPRPDPNHFEAWSARPVAN